MNFGLVMFSTFFVCFLLGCLLVPFSYDCFLHIVLNSVCIFLSLRYEIVEVALNLCFI